MRDTRLAMAQVAPTLGDVDRNVAMHTEWAATARRQGCELIVFPELSLCGYLLGDLVAEVALHPEAPAYQSLLSISQEIDVVAGFVELGEGYRYYNSAGYFSGGRCVHTHRKLYLPTYGMFQEGREFAQGGKLRAFDSDPGRSGILVCEDLWHQACAWLLAQDGAEIVYGVSNGPTRGTTPDQGITSLKVWEQLMVVTAQFLTSYMIYVNRVGCEDGLTFGGGSLVVDPFGRVAARSPALDDALTVVELESEVLRRARTAYPLLRDVRLDLVRRELERVRRERFDLPDDDGPSNRRSRPAGRSEKV